MPSKVHIRIYTSNGIERLKIITAVAPSRRDISDGFPRRFARAERDQSFLAVREASARGQIVSPSRHLFTMQTRPDNTTRARALVRPERSARDEEERYANRRGMKSTRWWPMCVRFGRRRALCAILRCALLRPRGGRETRDERVATRYYHGKSSNILHLRVATSRFACASFHLDKISILRIALPKR